MLRLCTILSILIFLFVMLIGAAMALGRATPLPEDITFLHLGDMCELPCWIGITPGKTTLEEAEKRVQQVYGNAEQLIQKQSYTEFEVATADEMKIKVHWEFGSDHVIYQILFSPSDSKIIPFGYVIKVAGLPKVVKLSGNSPVSFFPYNGYQYWVSSGSLQNYTHRDVISPRAAFSGIQLVQKSEQRTPEFGDVPWHGFGIYEFIYFEPVPDCGCAN